MLIIDSLLQRDLLRKGSDTEICSNSNKNNSDSNTSNTVKNK